MDTNRESEPEASEHAATLRLALVSGVGPRIRQALLDRFGTAEAVFSAAEAALRETAGIGPKLARAISAARTEIDIPALLAECAASGVSIITQRDTSRYPRPLLEIHDPPGVLFVRGELKPEDALAIGIVGTRHATHYGLAQAERLAGGLARAGLTVVSGLARGIDGAAHRGALEAGGRTIAVLASGVRNIYPPEHAKLADEIERQGAVVSESAPQAAPRSGVFPQRNRVISGMSLGVLVIEAAARSGALITARHAMEQGRDVFAVPGRVDNRVARGCHALLYGTARSWLSRRKTFWKSWDRWSRRPHQPQAKPCTTPANCCSMTWSGRCCRKFKPMRRPLIT